MRLSLTEAVEYLGVSERTARRWIKDRGLPVHRAEERLFVNPVELWEWAVEQNVPVSPRLLEQARRSPDPVAPISTLLEAGGIHHEVPGRTRREVLRAVVARLPLPGSVDREFLATALAGREAMGSTGIGHGIAIPHVRNPIVLQVEDPLVSLCLLTHAVDFGAIDGQPVHALFTVISPTVPMHLRMLAALGFLLNDPELRRRLQERAPSDRLLDRVRFLERSATPRPGEAGGEAAR
ncbi:MAG TPA: PTS sugar transporter subunit IIA [Candidatus Eisenbacteria bacterium]